MSDLLLHTFVKTQTTALAVRDRLLERAKDERGAETVQVIMIMGIMAIIIGAVFLVGGDSSLKGRISSLGSKVKNCVTAVTGSGSC